MNRKSKTLFVALSLASLFASLTSCQPSSSSSSEVDTGSSIVTTDSTIEETNPPVSENKIKLSSPSDGEQIQITPTPLMDYVNAKDEKSQIEAILKARETENKNLTCTSVKLSWEKDGSANYTIYLDDNDKFDNALAVKVSSLSNSYSLDNLIPNTTYYWKVKGTKAKDTSKVSTFKTIGTSVRFINASGAYNIRDLGGWKAGDKTIKYGKLFRGGLLNNFNNWADLDENGKKVFNETLGIKTEIDLRITGKDDGNQAECAFDSSKKYIQAQLGQYNKILDPENYAASNNFDSYGDLIASNYNLAVSNDGISVKSLREIFETLSDETNYPIYFHCNAGADRTGTLAFLIEGLLGVTYEDTIRDFELTSFSKFGERLRSALTSDNTFDDSGVYMDRAGENYVAFGKLYNDLMQYYGDGKTSLSYSIENYLTRYVGIPSSSIAKVKEILLGEENKGITLSTRQEFMLDNETISLNLEEAGLDEITSISLGNIDLGKDPASISLKAIKDKGISGEKEIVIVGKKGDKETTIYAPILLISKIISTKEEFIALDTYRAKVVNPSGTGDRVINFGYYRLANDIGNEGSPVNHGGWISDQISDNGAVGFRGVIDGAGHTVFLTPTYAGLFSVVGGGAILKNINFSSVKFGTSSGSNAVSAILGATLCGATLENVNFNILADGFGANYQNCLFVSGGGLISSNMAHSNYFKNVTVNSVAPIVSLLGGLTYEGMGGCVFDNFVLNCDQLAYVGIKRNISGGTITLDKCYLPMEMKGITGSYKTSLKDSMKLDISGDYVSIEVDSKYAGMTLNKATYNGKNIENATYENGLLMFEKASTLGVNPAGNSGVITLNLEKDNLNCSYSISVTM